MNRTERRKTIRMFNNKKGLQKKTTKGAFGEKPTYLKPDKPQDIVVEKPKDHNIAGIQPEKAVE